MATCWRLIGFPDRYSNRTNNGNEEAGDRVQRSADLCAFPNSKGLGEIALRAAWEIGFHGLHGAIRRFRCKKGGRNPAVSLRWQWERPSRRDKVADIYIVANETDTGAIFKKSKQTRGRVLARTPVQVEDRPLKKQTGRSDMHNKDPIDQALPQPRRPRLSRPRPQ
jgi:hypothetical protein